MEDLAFLLPLHHLYSLYSLFYSVSDLKVNYLHLQSSKIHQCLYYHLLAKSDRDQAGVLELSLGMWVGREGFLKRRVQWIELDSCVWNPYVYRMLDLLTYYLFLLCCKCSRCHRRVLIHLWVRTPTAFQILSTNISLFWSLAFRFDLNYNTLKKSIYPVSNLNYGFIGVARKSNRKLFEAGL